MIRYSIVVYGIVQGVGFRRFTRRQAKLHDITGWVRNAENGTVEMEAEGSFENLEPFLEAIKIGPKRSKVERLEVKRMETLENYFTFKTKY